VFVEEEMMTNEEDQKAYDESMKKVEQIAKQGFGTTYACCDLTFENRKELSDHLSAVHGIDIREQKFTRKMTMHLDGRDFYASSYSWSCEAVTFTEFIKNKRGKNDMMRYA